MEPTIGQMFCDGGLLSANPSALGGTWAYRLVDANNVCVAHASGIILPEQVGLPVVTNNVAELLAAIKGLEALPDGWHGQVMTDSNVTRCRIKVQRPRHAEPAGMVGVPVAIQQMLEEAKRRLGSYSVTLLGGHPTTIELSRGYRRLRKGKLSVSWHNVQCDEACKAEARRFHAAARVG